MEPKTALRLDLAFYGELSMARQERTKATSETIGRRLARLRKERGITQTELAAQLGVTQSHVSEWERGNLRLHGELIAKIAQHLSVSADELLGLTSADDRPHAPNRRLVRRLRDFDKLPKRDQEALLRTIDAFLSKAS